METPGSGASLASVAPPAAARQRLLFHLPDPPDSPASPQGRRYPKAHKDLALKLGAEYREEGKGMKALCGLVGIHRATYYEWKRAGETPAPQPNLPAWDPALFRVMEDEVRRLIHNKRRTWGTETIYEAYRELLPRRVIEGVIARIRSQRNQKLRRTALRYEFVAVGLAWSVDFKDVHLGGRVMRIQEEKARKVLAYEHRAGWTGEDTAQYFRAAALREAPPYFAKHDLGTEYRSDAFQGMLRALKIISLPNPGWYPQYNGKHEKVNSGIQQWLLKAHEEPRGDDGRPPAGHPWGSEGEVLNELDAALFDHNRIRPRESLGWRTPDQVYRFGPRKYLDRDRLYARWEELKAEIVGRWREKWAAGRGASASADWASYQQQLREMEANRIAALAVLAEGGLVRYSCGKQALEV